MGSSLNFFRADNDLLTVLLGALFSFPVSLSLSLCFSGHVICSLAVLLYLLLTPPRTMTSYRPHVDLWPHIFNFFATSPAFPLFWCSWKPHLFECLLSDWYRSHHTDCVLSTHWDGGGDPRSLSLSLAVSVCDHQALYSSLLSLPSYLSACACGRLSTLTSHLSLHEDPGMRVRSAPACWMLLWHMMPLGQQRYVFACHAYWRSFKSVSVLLSNLSHGGLKRLTNLFCEICLFCSCMNVVVAYVDVQTVSIRWDTLCEI